MKRGTIELVGERLAEQVERDGQVVWAWSRWKRWTREEIQQVADLAGITFSSPGNGHDLTFFAYP